MGIHREGAKGAKGNGGQAAGRRGVLDGATAGVVVEGILEQGGAPGAGVALVVDGEVWFEGGVGVRVLGGNEPMGDGARFYIYSVTKMMIATAVLQLVEAGRLRLATPVEAIVPGLALERPVTVGQLLNHSGGVPDYGALPAYQEAVRSQPGRPWTREAFVAHTLGATGLLFEPGEGWAYSNVGYLLLVQLLETMTGQPLAAVLRRQIFEPCGAEDMGVAESMATAKRLTPGYTAYFGEGGALEDMRARYHPGWVSHGVVVAGAGEVARFVEALFRGRLLGRDLLEKMVMPRPVGGAHRHIRKPAYGLGVMLDAEQDAGLTAGHGGGGPGYAAAAFHFSNVAGKGVTSVALVNCDRSDLGMDIAFALKGLVEAL